MDYVRFRLFVSSTFGDFSKEREILHKEVFPKIDEYCNEIGFSFQPIDLRWGVSSDASNDQKTLEVCLEEVRACKHFPYPNFLIMAGDRYGTIILPSAIEKENEFDILEKFISEDDFAFLKDWYVLDKNQIPESYILQPRKDEYTDRENWKPVNNRLLNILQDASQKASENNEITKKQTEKYFISATEAEVIEGIFDYKEKTEHQDELLKNKVIESSKIDKEYLYGYSRTIENVNGNYVDKHDDLKKLEQLKEKAQEFKETLSRILDKNNNLKPLKFDSVKDYEDNNLKEFEDFIYKKLIDAIDIQKNKLDETSNLEKEKLEQQKFKNDKVEGFQGREKILNEIQKYISNKDTNSPLVIHGPSGMGKSSLMAKAIAKARFEFKDTNTELIYRFVGATQNSTTIRNLLISICNELKNEDKQSNEYELEEYKFNEQIKDILSNIESPTTIFIDALDQLQFKDSLQWLPKKINPNLRIILSVLNDDKYERDTHYYNILKNIVNSDNLIDITQDSLEDQKSTLISNLLNALKRKLNPTQEKYLLDKWEETNYSPLYLKIAIEEVKHWKSDDTDFKLETCVEGIIKEYLENLTTLFHHEEIFVNKVFGYIHASKDGLSEKELLQIVSEDLEDEEEFQKKILSEQYEAIRVENSRRDNREELFLPMSLWSRLHTQIKPFIIERNIDNQPLIKFFHRQFTTVIDDLTKQNQIKLHTKLSEYFYTLQNKNETWDKRYNNLHMLSEYPYQLFHSKKTEELKEILFDLEFAGSVYDNNKQDGFSDIMEKATRLDSISEDMIYPWKSFYREKEHLILKVNEELCKPHQSLFQLAYEDGDDSPLSDKAEEIVRDKKIDFKWLKIRNRNSNFKRSGLLKFFSFNELAYMELEGNINSLENGKLMIHLSQDLYLLDLNMNLEFKVDNVEKSIIIINKILLIDFDGNKRILDCEKNTLNHLSIEDFTPNFSNNSYLFDINNEYLKIWDASFNYLKQIDNINFDENGFYELEKYNVVIMKKSNCFLAWDFKGKSLNSIDLSHSIDNFCIYETIHNKVKVLDRKKNIIREFEFNCEEEQFSFSETKEGLILSSNETNYLYLWDKDGELIKKIYIGFEAINGFIIIEDKIITYTKSNEIKIWNLNHLINIRPNNNDLNNIKFLNSDILVTVSENNYTLRLWNNNNELVALLKGHKDNIKDIIKLFDGLLLSYGDKEICLWSNNGELLWSFTFPMKDNRVIINEAIELKSGNIIFLFGPILFLLNRYDSTFKHFHNESSDIIKLIELANGNILSCSKDNLRIWNQEFKCISMSESFTDEICGVLELNNGNILSWSKNNLKIWNQEFECIAIFKDNIENINGALELDNGQIILFRLPYSYNKNSIFKIKDMFKLRNLIYKTSGGSIYMNGFSEKGISVLDVSSKLIKDLPGHEKCHIGKIFTTSSGKFITYSHGDSIRFFDKYWNLISVISIDDNQFFLDINDDQASIFNEDSIISYNIVHDDNYDSI